MTQPLAVGNPAGPSVGDLLPGVQYAPPAAGQAAVRPAGTGLAAGGAAGPARPVPRTAGPAAAPLALVFVVAAVAVGVVPA